MTATPTLSHVAVDVDATAPTSCAVLGNGLVAGIAASAATVAVALTARAIDIPMQVAASASDVAEDIPLSGYVSLTLASTAIGTMLGVAFARYAKRPAHTFVVVSAVLTVISLVGPLTAHHATTATRAVLELTHVGAAAIVIPAVARRLPQRSNMR